jgi:uncharacterized protein YacL
VDSTRDKVVHALISGVVGLVIGLVVTYVVWLLTPKPWTLRSALLAVGFASFFAAFGGSMAALTRSGRRNLRS